MNTQHDKAAITWQLDRMDEGATEREARAALVMADLSAPLADRLAGAFLVQLWQDIGADELARMRDLNATPDYAMPVCASHDFCDANESMASAFSEIMGRPILPDDSEGMTDADCDLWNQAWTIARAQYLTA